MATLNGDGSQLSDENIADLQLVGGYCGGSAVAELVIGPV